jgi:hypothetical protein
MSWVDHVYVGGGERFIQALVGRPVGNIRLKDLGVDGSIILKVDLQDAGLEGTQWNDLVQNRDSWRVLMNTIMNFRVK